MDSSNDFESYGDLDTAFVDHRGIKRKIEFDPNQRIKHFTPFEFIVFKRIASHAACISNMQSQSQVQNGARFRYDEEYQYNIDRSKVKIYFVDCQDVNNKVFEEMEVENKQLMQSGDSTFNYPAVTSVNFLMSVNNNGKTLKNVLVVEFERPCMIQSVSHHNLIDQAFVTDMCARYHNRSEMTDPDIISNTGTDSHTKEVVARLVETFTTLPSSVVNKNRAIYEKIFCVCCKFFKSPKISPSSSGDRVISIIVSSVSMFNVSWDFMLAIKRIEDHYKRDISIEVIIKTKQTKGICVIGGSPQETTIDSLYLLINITKVSDISGDNMRPTLQGVRKSGMSSASSKVYPKPPPKSTASSSTMTKGDLSETIFESPYFEEERRTGNNNNNNKRGRESDIRSSSSSMVNSEESDDGSDDDAEQTTTNPFQAARKKKAWIIDPRELSGGKK